jgi:hypothetical protein
MAILCCVAKKAASAAHTVFWALRWKTKGDVRREPDRIGLLEKPPASSAFLPSRASTVLASLRFPYLQYGYEAIRVWSYTTFIV